MDSRKLDIQSAQAAKVPPRASAVRTSARVIWQFWKAYAEKVATYQTGAILTAVYLFVAGPIWVVGRITGHRFLPHKAPTASTFWAESHMGADESLDSLKEQG